jgi:hypothetical protein
MRRARPAPILGRLIAPRIRDDRYRHAEGHDLADVVAAWPGLPEPDKSGFVTMMTAVVSRW